MKKLFPNFVIDACVLWLFAIAWLQFPSPAQAYNEPKPRGVRVLTAFSTNSTIFAGVGGASASNTTNVWSGTQSNRLATAATLVLFQQTLPSAMNVCSDSIVRVTYRFENKNNTTNNGGLQVYLVNDASNYLTYDFGFAARDTNLTWYGDWSQYSVIKRKMTQVGTFNCSQVNSVLIGVKGQAATVDTVTLGEVATFKTRLKKGVLILTSDDLWSSFFTNGGGAKMDSLNYHYSVLLNAGLLGQANKMSAGQLDSLYAMGRIDVCNHGWTHDTIWTLSADSLTSLIRVNYNYIHSRGWRGDRLWATPFGQSSRAADSVLRNCGLIDFARTTQGNALGEAPPYNNPWAIRILANLGNTTSLAAAEAGVDDIVASKASGIILAHKLDVTATDINTWAVSDYLALWNYIKTDVDAGTLDVMSLSEYFVRSDFRPSWFFLGPFFGF